MSWDWSFLKDIINDPEVTEVLLTRHDQIAIEMSGVLRLTNLKFSGIYEYQKFASLLADEIQAPLNQSKPWSEGFFERMRIHIVSGDATHSEPAISIRKHPERVWTFDLLASKSWAPPEAFHALREWIVSRQNILVVGTTGAGKTSLLQACLHEVSAEQRCVILEDTRELKNPNPLSTQLLARPSGRGLLPEITLQDLFVQALRMRPDRLILGEVRSTEAKDLLLALSTGHRGSMGSLHAESDRQALLRLEMLVQMGAPQWSVETIRRLISLSIHGIAVVEKVKGQRRLRSLSQIAGLESNGLLLDPLFER